MSAMMPFDEISALTAEADRLKSPDRATKKDEVDKYIDEVTDLFVMSYVFGTNELNDELGTNIEPDLTEMRAVSEEKFDGKDYRDRIREYMESGTAYDIRRVVETDAHRVFNAALFTGAKKAGATKKTWQTMQDDRVRDTHDYLQGVTIGIDEEFYSYKGGSTLYPSQWGIAEEDINCRCWLTFSK